MKRKVEKTKGNKKLNEIFSFIVHKGTTSRREIEKELHYSWGSISTYVNKLIDSGLVIEKENIVNGLGRSTSILTPSKGKIVSLGVDFNSIGISSSLVDSDGTVLFSNLIEYNSKTQDDAINQIFDAIDQSFAFAKDKFEIYSIGLSIQGTISEDVYMKFPFINNWKPINIRKIVNEKYKTYTIIDNDNNFILKDVTRRYPNIKNTLVIRLVDGIGFGIIIDKPSFSNDALRINFGHSIVELNGEKCVCGRRGCLEAYSSIKGIMNRIGISDRDYFFEHKNEYRSYLDDASKYLGVMITNISEGFYLENIILTGKLIENDEEMVKVIKDTINSLQTNSSSKININVISDLNASFGAAIQSIESKINS